MDWCEMSVLFRYLFSQVHPLLFSLHLFAANVQKVTHKSLCRLILVFFFYFVQLRSVLLLSSFFFPFLRCLHCSLLHTHSLSQLENNSLSIPSSFVYSSLWYHSLHSVYIFIPQFTLLFLSHFVISINAFACAGCLLYVLVLFLTYLYSLNNSNKVKK